MECMWSVSGARYHSITVELHISRKTTSSMYFRGERVMVETQTLILNPSLSIECLSWVHLFTPWHQGHCVVTMCCRDEETAHWLFINPVVLPKCGNWKDHPYSTACSTRLSLFPHSLFFGFYLPFISHSQSCFLLPIGTQPCVFFQRLTWLGLESWSSNHDLLLCAHEWRAEPQLPGLPVFLN